MIRCVIQQLLAAITFLHERGIAHRDIKLDNIMIENIELSEDERDADKLNIKLTDFGFSTFYKTDKVTLGYTLGTPEYMAPETIRKGKWHDEKVDVWATSVLTYTLMSR